MGAFVDTSKVAITEGENTIWVKRQMDFGTQAHVEDTMTRIALNDGQVGEIYFTIGAQKLALAIHNIVGWAGPDFCDEGTGKLLPCTAENIRRLDPKFPLLLRAQERITELNTRKEDLSPLAATTDGETPMQASTPPLAAGTSI